jgi:hypothetical protein
MFRQIRILVLLLILFAVAMDAWLTRAYSTDWQQSLHVGVYPINADGSDLVDVYIAQLDEDDFEGIASFLEREAVRYGRPIEEPVRIVLGPRIEEQPPALAAEPNVLDIMLWSLRMRRWAGNVANGRERYAPDVRIFLRYHDPRYTLTLENSVGIEKGMFGIVNAYASRRHTKQNNVIIAHEFLHTLGATDKYAPDNAQPLPPYGIAEPDRSPLYPQRLAEIMGGRIPLSPEEAVIPTSLEKVIIGPLTAAEIRLDR